MVFGLNKKSGLNDSFQSVGSAATEFELDDPTPALIRGRQRSEGESSENRVRSRSSSAARKIASTVARFTTMRRTEAAIDQKEEKEERPSLLSAPSMAVMEVQSPIKSPRRRWRSKPPCNRGEEDLQHIDLDEKETTPCKIESKQEDDSPSHLTAASEECFDMEETILRSPAKTTRRRWRTPLKIREGTQNLHDDARTVDDDYDDASDHGSVVASVVSMFEWKSPRRSPRKMSQEAPEMPNRIPGSPPKSPHRIWNLNIPRSPVKASTEISAPPLHADEHSEAFCSMRDDGSVAASIASSPVKRRTSTRSSSKTPRRRFRSKTPESRKGNVHQALDSPLESPGSSPSKHHNEEPSDVSFHDSGSLISEMSGCNSIISRPSLLAAPSQCNFRMNNRPDLVANQASFRAQKSQIARLSPSKSGSQRSLTGILRNSSNHSQGGGAAKWSGSISHHCKKDPTPSYAANHVTDKDDMSQILEGESELEQSLLMSCSASVSVLDKSQNLSTSPRDEQADVPPLVKDVQEWRENRMRSEVTRNILRFKSSSERGTRSSMGLPSLDDDDDASASKNIVSLVSPRQRVSRKVCTKTTTGLNISDEKSRIERRSRESSAVDAERARGRSRGARHRESGRTSRSEQGDSKLSTIGDSRGKSPGRTTALRRGSASTTTRPHELSRHSERRSSIRKSSRSRTRADEEGYESSQRKDATISPEKNDHHASESSLRNAARKLADEKGNGERSERRSSRRDSTPTRTKTSAIAPVTPSKRREKIGVDEPVTPSRRRSKVVGDALETSSRSRPKGGVDLDKVETPTRRKLRLGSSQQEIDGESAEHVAMLSPTKRGIPEEAKRALAEDLRSKGSRTSTGNPRLRSKSLGRKSPIKASRKVEVLATPTRTRTDMRDKHGNSLTCTSNDTEASKNTKTSRPTGELRRARSKVFLKAISSSHMSSDSTMKVKIRKKERKTDDASHAGTIAQLQIPSLTKSSEAVLRVEYCEAPQVRVA